MRKSLFALILTVIMTFLITGCTSDTTDMQVEDTNISNIPNIQRELFAFPSAGSTNPPVESDGITENDETYNHLMDVEETPPSPQDEIVEDIELYNPTLQTEIVEASVFENPMVALVGGRENIPPPPFDVDIDFTSFRGDDFDDEYFRLMWETENSFGKIIRIIGTYDSFFDDYTERYHHFVLIDDAEGCCVLFFEFGWSEGSTPDVFPEQYAIIDLTGVFGEFYCHVLEWSFQFVVAESITVLQRSSY